MKLFPRAGIALLVATSAMAFTGTALAGEQHVVGQKNKAFTTKTIRAKVGDKLVFRNDDAFHHNVFSLSDTQSFDLGSFGQGVAREVVLTKTGTLEIECAIHPEMKLIVEVGK